MPTQVPECTPSFESSVLALHNRHIKDLNEELQGVMEQCFERIQRMVESMHKETEQLYQSFRGKLNEEEKRNLLKSMLAPEALAVLVPSTPSSGPGNSAPLPPSPPLREEKV